MAHLEADDLKRLNTLLERTGEFIAYFELAESKMIEWRQEMTQVATSQQEQLTQMKLELDRMQTVISEAGLECFRTAAEETVSQGDDYLHMLRNTEQQLLRQIHDHRAELTRITQHAMTRITQKSAQALSIIDEKLSHYDPKQFDEIAHKSCEEVSRSAKDVLTKGGKLLQQFEWRSVTLTLVTSMAAALVFGLYVNGEYPWEIHQHVVNERGAGKVLLDAWPSLTYHEKNKILHNRSY